MLDLNGIELQVGDNVIYTNRNLDELRKGKISKITAKRITIEISPPTTGTYTLPNGTIHNWTSKNEHIITYSQQIMKLDND